MRVQHQDATVELTICHVVFIVNVPKTVNVVEIHLSNSKPSSIFVEITVTLHSVIINPVNMTHKLSVGSPIER